MKHLMAYAIKFVATFILLGIILGAFFNYSFTDVLLITFVLTLAGYIIGDLLILPRTNNSVASAADFGIAFLVVLWLSNYITYEDDLITASLVSAIAVTLMEFLYHKIVARIDPMQAEETGGNVERNQYQTEASEELAPVRQDVRSQDTDEMDNNNQNK
ncbi:YndM family protein [Bacillus sp. M6-12]|uniref:YndM family protein n=1 Tax=Bacillus sp. M6-12 TaxID=2054166 RepID=UPI0015E13FBA|nr:YndM family protein [Bacillus sp. M6-12]